MDAEPPSIAAQLHTAVVAAFPSYVRERLQRLGVAEDDALLADALAAATGVLDAQLAEIGEGSLRESPLELVRISTEPLTAVLRERGIVPVPRDARSAELHPDDVYDLYPATSRDLGEDVWRIHMEWGIERARQVAGVVPASPGGGQPVAVPAVALFGLSEPLRSEVADALRSMGYRPLLWRNPAALDAGLAGLPRLVVVELDHPGADSAIRQFADKARVVAIGKEVNDFVEAATMALGAEEVVDSGRILDRLGALLPRLV